MSYEVTATRRRPRMFDELIGQEFVVATLKNSLSSGRIAHAYLFAGPRGVGKTSAARILAKALNCPEGPNAEGCENWEGSDEIARGTALDVIEIDGASNTSVNDVRQIKDEVLFAPNNSRYKIYIIDEVHMLSNSAFNALLKTIEEPPPYIIFIFATTEIHKVPATIRSRCQQFNFRLIPLERIRESLAATTRELGVSAEEDALGWIAREATGSLRDAYTLFDQVLAFSHDNITLDLIHEKLGLLGMERLNVLFGAVVRGEVTAVLDLVEEALLAGVSVERFTIDLADYLRTLLLIRNGVTREGIIGISLDRIPEEVRNGFTREQLETANEVVLQLYRDLRYSVNQRFDLELALSRLANLKNYLTPQELVTRIDALQHELIHSAAHHVRQDDAIGREVMPANAEDQPGEDRVGEDHPAEDHPTRQPTDGQATGGQPATDQAPNPPVPGQPDIPQPLAVELDDPDAPPVPASFSGITEEQVQAIISRFRTERISVAAFLAAARSWVLRDGSLVIGFRANFAAHALENDRDVIRDAALSILGVDTLRVELVIRGQDGTEEQSAPVAEHVEMVRRVFRGEIVEGNQ